MPDDDANEPRPLLRPPLPPVGPPPPDVLPPPGNPKGSRYDPGLREPPVMLPGNPKGSRYDAGPGRSRPLLLILAVVALAVALGALVARLV